MDVFDVAIIGGGINGCGCAADASLRGLSVVLCEQGDLAGKTSSSSTKLIHGGLRYLESYDFAMVKKSLDERQTLLQLAPHLIYPLPIVLPQQTNMRPMWMLRAGLFLYDHLSRKNKLPKSKLIRRNKYANYFRPLAETLNAGFLFYDCTTDDARLTISNAKQAQEHGATILPNTELIHAEIDSHQQWRLCLRSKTAELLQIRAKTLINASGPWVEPVSQLLKVPLQHAMTLVKGSHLVVHKLYEGDHAYLLQHDDKRIVFVLPYHGYTMIGTTDVPFTDSLEEISIAGSEIDYLCDLVNQYFKKKITASEIINSWSGVRPLIAETGKSLRKISRDYAYHFGLVPAPIVTIYGGKITTYRQLAAEVIDQLRAVFPNLADSSTAITPLPGAAMASMGFKQYQPYAQDKYHWLDPETLTRYLHTYGTHTEQVLTGCNNIHDLGFDFTNTLYQVEADYLLENEWATTCDDILWRRTKLGLAMDATSQKALADYLATKLFVE